MSSLYKTYKISLKIARFKKKTEDWIASHVQKYITNQSGHDIPFSIDWDSFGDMVKDEDFLKRGLNYSVLESNIKKLCRDDLGKSAFKENVKAIIVQHSDSEEPEEMGYILKKGTLTFITNQKKRIYGSLTPMEHKLENLF